MQRLVAIVLLSSGLSGGALASGTLTFDTGQDRLHVSCAAFLSARIEEDPSLDDATRTEMKEMAFALLKRAHDARTASAQHLARTHQTIIQERLGLLSTGFRVRMRQNIQAHGSIVGDDQAILDEQIVCNDLFRTFGTG